MKLANGWIDIATSADIPRYVRLDSVAAFHVGKVDGYDTLKVELSGGQTLLADPSLMTALREALIDHVNPRGR